MRKIGQQILDYFKRADKLLWIIITAISIYALILLNTVPYSGDVYKRQTISLMTMALF